MYCPECGNDAAEAKFCVECGSRMPKKDPAGQKTGSGSARPRAQRRAAERRERSAPPQSKTPVALIWGGFAAAAAVVVLIVALASGGSGGGVSTSGAESVTADTSGSYSELVTRANGLYDEGIEAFNRNDAAAGEQAFRNAAAVYEAAWQKQPGDPNVGTDHAVALFYSRHHDEALERIDLVIKGSPDFQPAHLNKGVFLKTEWQEATEAGEKDKAARYLEQARLTLQKAIDIDARSESGQRAAEILKSI